MTSVAASASGALQLERLKAFVDGVLAIVVTVLVLELEVPEVDPREGLPFLQAFWHGLHPYAGSFAITAAFWMQHAVILHYVPRADRSFVWLNVLFLFPVTLLPFATELRVSHGTEPAAALLFGGIPTLAGLLSLAIWGYAAVGRRFVSPDVDPAVVRSLTLRLGLTPVLCVVAGAVSGASEHLATAVFGTVLLMQLSHGKADAGWQARGAS